MYPATPVVKKRSSPKALNASANRCAYCGKFKADSYLIGWNTSFGIAACIKHAEWAKWDCKSYMHKNEMVRLEDGLLHRGIRGFINSLYELEGGFTDGETRGWNLTKDLRQVFFVRIDGEWTIPIYNQVNQITKRIAIRRFEDEDVVGPIIANVPLEFPQYIQYTLTLLNYGIYSDYERITGSL